MDGKIIVEVTSKQFPVIVMQGKINAEDMLVVANNIKRHYREVYIPALQRELAKKQAEAELIKKQQVAVDAKKAEAVKAQEEKLAAVKPPSVERVIKPVLPVK